tara:strand:- start:19845 stop:20072 length:228 start_codon:yes stop_codon:yes gene_type:complete
MTPTTLAREALAHPSDDGWRKHDGYSYPGDPATVVEIVFHNGRASKDIRPAKDWTWDWPRNGPLDFSIAYWRLAK